MCGIVGYTGRYRAADVLIEGLKRLEYRGYDSAGIATVCNSQIKLHKKKGRIKAIEKEALKLEGGCGIGHTRWATHGAPSDENSHPLRSGKFAVVHNGIIENYLQLKVGLVNKGVKFSSETDTEVIAHLINENYQGDFLVAVKQTVDMLSGSFALAVICEDFPQTIAVAKRNNPLIVGRGDGENFIASDIPAIAGYTREVYVLKDDDIGLITPDTAVFYGEGLCPIDKDSIRVEIQPGSLDIGNNESFMIKEIGEIPQAIRDTVSNFYYNTDKTAFREFVKDVERVVIFGCGTAYHSAVLAKYVIESVCRINVEVDIASEFRYRNPVLRYGELAVAVSQSGETADTIAACKLARERGCHLAVITNVASSSITDYADFVFPIMAGAEIAVAATKSYNCQLAMFYMLAYEIKSAKSGEKAEISSKLKELPALCKKVIDKKELLNEFAGKYSKQSSVFFLGRGLDYAVSMEGSLKLKEISYIHSEGYAAGELKHGTLALIEKDSLVVAVITQRELIKKTVNAVHEVKARGAAVLLITQFKELTEMENIDKFVLLPETDDMFMPIISVIPLQVFAYYMARARGNDPDKPRNLAKSVTVE